MTRKPGRSILGAHVSGRGDLVKAFDEAEAAGAECLQIFSRSPGMWRCRDLRDDEGARFRKRRAELGNLPVLVHDIYLTNLAAAEGDLRDRSIATLTHERERADCLGADAIVCHMGAHLGVGVDVALERYTDALREVLLRTRGLSPRMLLENAAGQGTTLGSRFEEIARVLDDVNAPDETGACFDTCHAFAAGYDFTTEEGYVAMWDAFASTVGFERLHALHLNDSKRALACRVDRHEHVGKGHIGKEAFGRIVRDPRLAGRPMVIEIDPTGDALRKDLNLLKRLRRGARCTPTGAT